MESEASGHVKLSIKKYSLIVLIDNDPDFFSFFVLCCHIDIFLFPIHMHFKLVLVVYRRFQNEIIKSAADKGVGVYVSIGHVVVLTYLLLLLCNLFALSWVTTKLHNA